MSKSFVAGYITALFTTVSVGVGAFFGVVVGIDYLLRTFF